MAAKKSYKVKVKYLAKQIEAAIIKEVKALLSKKRFARKPAKKAARKATRTGKNPSKKAQREQLRRPRGN